jgi:Tol biopolymer transport system component
VDIWQLDLSNGTPLRLTFEKGHSMMPVWSPDGKSIIFSSNPDGVFNLCQMAAGGGGSQKWILKSSESKFPTNWSSDGHFLLYTELNPKTKADLWVLPLEDDPRPIRLLNTNFRESDGCFSPDMRWIAYVSDETGRDEVFVRSFSRNSDSATFEASRKWLISKGGGIGPRWARNGKELYYMASDWKVMAVAITADADTDFHPAEPKPLFQVTSFVSSTSYTLNTGPWEVAPNGDKFIAPSPAIEGSPSPFTVILNWTALLKK